MANAKPQMKKETSTLADIDERIRRRAFELFQIRGCQDGRDMDDWLQAEAEVTGRPRKLANLTVVK